ncbi:FCD domain-containing protein [Erythrobacter arachoides]|uniref:FCD domain-containing protein n=2 Tax=Aurantiacibacter arachoides TaxID=1850444 RepID=A0A845A4H0_9SPHN|nr:FCD domain-containing protein [Aurantiacibacter arachoides]
MQDAIERLAKRGPSAADIADWIRSQIRGNRLVPGQRLIEVDIIRQTGGSRFKVREAYQRLAAEGLLEIEEYRGASVRGTSMAEVRQLYRARAALEGLCAGDFVRKATDDQIARLEEVARAMEECVEAGRPEDFARINAEWHTLLMHGAGNFAIEDIVRRLNTPVHHLQFGTFYRGERLREAARDHRHILAAIQARDADAAERAMRQHVENGLVFLSELDRAVHLEA